MTEASDVPAQAAQLIVGETTFALPLAGMIDIEAERARLTKAIGKTEGEITRIDKKLGNEKFVANAPDEVVVQEREKREAYIREVESLKAALQRLS